MDSERKTFIRMLVDATQTEDRRAFIPYHAVTPSIRERLSALQQQRSVNINGKAYAAAVRECTTTEPAGFEVTLEPTPAV